MGLTQDPPSWGSPQAQQMPAEGTPCWICKGLKARQSQANNSRGNCFETHSSKVDSALTTQQLDVVRNSPGESLGLPVALYALHSAWVCEENQFIPGPSRTQQQPCLRHNRKCQEGTLFPQGPHASVLLSRMRMKREKPEAQEGYVFMDGVREVLSRISRKAPSSPPPWPPSWCWDSSPQKQHCSTLEPPC